MKTVRILVLNVLVVGLGIGAYHLLVSGTPAPATDGGSGIVGDGVERRLTALEDAVSRPAVAPRGTDAGTASRLASLEVRLEVLERGIAAERSVEEAPAAPSTGPGDLAGAPDDLFANDVEKFRDLQAKAREAERLEKTVAYVDKALKPLALDLSEQQRRRLAKTALEYEPRRRKLWEEAKARGNAMGKDVDWEPLVRETNETITREFAGKLRTALPSLDAAVVASALYTPGK